MDSVHVNSFHCRFGYSFVLYKYISGFETLCKFWKKKSSDACFDLIAYKDHTEHQGEVTKEAAATAVWLLCQCYFTACLPIKGRPSCHLGLLCLFP
jgi:hypothetical protein